MGTIIISALGHERMANSIIKSRVMRFSHGIKLNQSGCFGSAESGRSSTGGSSSPNLIVKDQLKELLSTA